MLKSIYLFFKKEPKYFWFFLAALAFYGFVFWGSQPVERPPSQLSPGMTDFRTSQERWSRDMAREGAFHDFAKREPLLAILFEFMTLFFFLAFVAGVILNILRIWKPFLFEKFGSGLSPPPTQAWPFSILFKVVVLFVIAGILVSFLMGIAAAFLPKGTSENYFRVLHTLIVSSVCLYFMVKFVQRSGGHWQDLGLRIPRTGFLREVLAGFAGYLRVLPFFAVALVVLLGVASLFHYVPPTHPIVNIFLEEERRAPLLVGLSLLLGTVVGPIFEEIFFRGFCYPILRDRWGKFWGMGLSAAFFAGIHHSGFVFWPVFILGVALAHLYEKRRSLIASITLHITHNTLFIGYFFLVKQIVS